jgi:hypothetical protein
MYHTEYVYLHYDKVHRSIWLVLYVNSYEQRTLKYTSLVFLVESTTLNWLIHIIGICQTVSQLLLHRFYCWP